MSVYKTVNTPTKRMKYYRKKIKLQTNSYFINSRIKKLKTNYINKY